MWPVIKLAVSISNQVGDGVHFPELRFQPLHPQGTHGILPLSLSLSHTHIFFLSLIYLYIYSDQGIVVLTCVHKVSPRRKWMETMTLKSLGFALGMRLGLWLAQLSLIVVLIGSILIRHTIYLLKIPNLHASIRACNCLSQNYLSPSSYPQFFLILIVCLF